MASSYRSTAVPPSADAYTKNRIWWVTPDSSVWRRVSWRKKAPVAQIGQVLCSLSKETADAGISISGSADGVVWGNEA